MIINVNNREKIINTILIYVNFMLIYVNITDRQPHQKSSSEPHKSNISVENLRFVKNQTPHRAISNLLEAL